MGLTIKDFTKGMTPQEKKEYLAFRKKLIGTRQVTLKDLK